MRILEKYTGEKTYMFPSGAIATPEATLNEFPACLTFAHVVETDDAGEVMFALQNLGSLRSQYNIDPALSEDDAIAAIQEILNYEPPAVIIDETESTPEERIAAALEYANVLAMPTVTSEDPDTL